ncbi:MAG TPA: bifunctional glutamine synthetase adenylyltransferase/deadenyltransferase, partial [Burkholderiales bacterium]|nr:bifunctional glutamine synthetase adenylyltransferase/deadenyltransferase [Burkholderiales bacterium]
LRRVNPAPFLCYLDFGAFGSMRELHAQIRQQVRRREMHDNIKLGPGGIREIEFIVQVFQLIRGGRDNELRIRSTLAGLDLLGKRRMLPLDAVEELKEAYVFLRNLEHRLQYLDDSQTQDIPSSKEDRLRVAGSMGFADHEAFFRALDVRRERVEHHFEAVFAEPEKEAGEREQGCDLAGFEDQAGISLLFERMREGSLYRHLPASSQKLVDGLVPMMSKAALTQPNPDQTLKRMLDLLETVSRRSAYLALLTEYPHTLEKIARLAGASLWASDYLRLHPILLDELLDERALVSPFD